MVAVSEISWEEVADPAFGNPARQAWRAAVAQVADKAKATLPECTGRVDRAVTLVLAGDVQLLADGTARVGSQSSGRTQYVVCNGVCPCKDFAAAPHGFCKHRLGAAIARRAQDLLHGQGSNGLGDASPVELPAPAPAAAAAFETPLGVPAQHVVMIQGKPFVKFAGLLQMAHERGLVALTAAWTYNDAELSLAHATATFQDGRSFAEAGDATPANVNRKVAPHFRRVALTRALARCLRHALNVDLVAVEELGED